MQRYVLKIRLLIIFQKKFLGLKHISMKIQISILQTAKRNDIYPVFHLICHLVLGDDHQECRFSHLLIIDVIGYFDQVFSSFSDIVFTA